MTFFGAWIFVCLTMGLLFFFVIGLFFLKKEADWNKLEKDKEMWFLLTEMIHYVTSKNPELEKEQVEREIKEMMSFMNLTVQEEYLQMLVSVGARKKQ